MADNENISHEDLDLIGDQLDDAAKDEQELWEELEQDEAGTDPDQETTLSDIETDPDPEEDRGKDPGTGAADDDWVNLNADDTVAKQGQQQQPSPGEPSEIDWSSAPPEIRDAYQASLKTIEKLKSDERAAVGRARSLQRQMDDLRQQASASAPSTPAAKAAGQQSAKAGKQASGQSADYLESEEWKNLQDEYPEIAGPVASVIKAQQETIATMSNMMSSINDDRRQNDIAHQEEILLEAHPDAFDLVGDDFVKWVQAQPRHIREAAMRNGSEIIDAEEAIDVITRFKQHKQASDPGAWQQRTNGGQGNTRPKNSNGSGRPNLRRQQQIRSAVSAKGKGAGAATGIPADGDPEQIWKQFDAMEERESRA